MQQADSSATFKAWVNWQNQNIDQFIDYLRENDLSKAGPLIQASTLSMHQSMWCQTPPVNYWQDTSFALWKRLFELQGSGIEAYGTMDAGPHLKIVHERKNSELLLSEYKDLIEKSSLKTYLLSPGPGSHLRS